MSNTIKTKKGYDIKIIGEAACVYANANASELYAIKPLDFKSLKPKLTVKQGNKVKAGDSLFTSKADERIRICSPVSGEITEIKRGAKRAILEVIIKADSKTSYTNFGSSSVDQLSADEVKEKLLSSGAWAHILQRPFEKIANPNDKPKAIFISGFDTSPLAPRYNFILAGQTKAFQEGINALAKLTDGMVHLNLNAEEDNNPTFENCKGVEKTYFEGPHPVGNVGVQIHHINPINKGDVVWTINPQDVLILGNLFLEGIYKAERTINLSGPGVKNPKYYKTTIGSSVSPFIKGNTKEGEHRIISGNPLTGTQVAEDGYLGFYQHGISVLEENTEPELFGWLLPSYARPSISRTFLEFLSPKKEYNTNTNMHGEERAFVFTGHYDKVMPMDILPLHLIKASLANNIDALEELGIYEVAAEDFALCEFICPSKAPLQQIIEDGLKLIEEEA